MNKSILRGIAAVILFFLGCVSMQASTALCPFGQMSQQPWQAKYFFQWYSYSDPDNWYATDYNESELQTISGPISTAQGLPYYVTDWGENYYTYFLRRHFNVSSLNNEFYALYVSHDDGCEVYLNGVQVYKNSECLIAPDYKTVYFPKELLHTGDNVLAVKVRDSGGGEAFADFGIYSLDIPWIEVELSSPGTLGQEVLYQVNMLSDVEFIRVKGTMNSNDWTTLKNMANLKGTDLSQATAVEVPREQFRDRTDFIYMLLPKGIKTIGEYAFFQTALGSIDIPTSVTNIDNYAFSYCSDLTSVTIPNSVTTIGKYVFYDNKCLLSVDIAANSMLGSIGVGAFEGCESLPSIVLPSGITKLEDVTFYRCYALKSVSLPPALESICSSCFQETHALKSIDFPQTLTDIGPNAFYYSGLENVVLPQNLSYLGRSAFESCQNMKSIQLPATPTLSYEYGSGYFSTFNNCTSLQTIVCLSATPPIIGRDPFSGVDRSQVTLVVPAFAIVDYKLDTYWHDFGSIVEGAEPDLLNIGSLLTLTNNRRPTKKTDVLLSEGGALVVGGNAPFEVGTLTFCINTPNNGFGQLQNTSPAMTADQVTTRFFAWSNRWYFVTPLHDVNVGDVVHDNAEASFIFRYYNGQNRASNGPQGSWQDLIDNTLHAGQGYIFLANRDGWITMPATATGKAPALVSDDVTTPLKTYAAANAADASWNFVGNPYPCYYDTYSMELAAPITVWDYDNWTYRAYSPVDDGYVLRPMEAFFVQKPASLNQILFPQEGRLFTAEAEHPEAARSAENNSRQLFDIVLTDGTRSDQTRLVANPQASIAYEPLQDATKFISTESTLQLFTLDKEGNQLAINERPLATADAVALGFSVTATGIYTISLGRGNEKLLLHDALTGQTVDLSQQSYVFSIDEPVTSNQRFSLTIGGQESTEVNAVAAQSPHNAPVYNLQGRPQRSASTDQHTTISVKQGKKYLVK